MATIHEDYRPRSNVRRAFGWSVAFAIGLVPWLGIGYAVTNAL